MKSPSTTARSACGVWKRRTGGCSRAPNTRACFDVCSIRNANILLVSIKALANEIAKNLVLAGIGSITLADHEVVTEDDLGAQFFVSEADVGNNVSVVRCRVSILSNQVQRAQAAAPQVQKLNPRVKVNVLTRDVRNEPDPAFYQSFDVIIATDIDFNSQTVLNAGARVADRPFYAGGTHGFYGYIFADLGTHDFVIEREKSNRATASGVETATRSIVDFKDKVENGKHIELVTKRELYTPLMLANTSPLSPEMQKDPRKLRKVHPLLTCFRTLWALQRNGNGGFPTHSPAELQQFTSLAMEKHKELMLPAATLTADFLKSFLGNLGSELAPVTAFLGGQLAQDVINVLGKREQPIQNLMLFDGEECAAPVYALHPIFPDNPLPAISSIPVDAPVEVL
jgi:ubiquitin-like 1-activating enzyme E1 A